MTPVNQIADGGETGPRSKHSGYNDKRGGAA